MASSVGIRVLKAWRRAFGVVFDECRDAAGLSQEDLTAASGLDRKFISSVENAHQAPGLNSIVRAARAMNISVTEMMARTERLAEPSSTLESLAEHAQTKLSLGRVKCPKCEAVYELHVRRAENNESSYFNCRFCKLRLAKWDTPATFIYEARRGPLKWQRTR